MSRWIEMTRLLAITLSAALASSPTAAETSKPEAAFAAGKCQLCHSVAAAGIPARNKSDKNTAPDLSGYKSPVPMAALSAYLRQETKLGENEHKLPFKGSDEELQAIVDWLGSLEATE